MALIKDLHEANTREFVAILQKREAALKRARASAKPGGDFFDTITAQIDLVAAAIDAAQAEYQRQEAESR